MTSVKLRFEGRVQGVCFRAFVEENANELGVTGYVKNMADGSVEAVFCGDEKNVAELIKRCKAGPILAKVEKIKAEPIDRTYETYASFEIK